MAEREINALNVIDTVNLQAVAQTMQKISQFQTVVKNTLKEGHDYGKIPGTDKPTLLKPGAEKILMLMGLTSEYDVIEKVQDYDSGFFAFTVKCTILKGSQKITEGLGHANTKEARYLNRWVTEKKIPEGIDKDSLVTREKPSKFKEGEFYTEYLIENADGHTLANTVLKMAKKRSQVDAALTVASLSDIFTQDLEDMEVIGGEPAKSRSTGSQRQQQNRTPQQNGATEKIGWSAFWSEVKNLGVSKEDVHRQVAATFNLPQVPKSLTDVIQKQVQLDLLLKHLKESHPANQQADKDTGLFAGQERQPGED